MNPTLMGRLPAPAAGVALWLVDLDQAAAAQLETWHAWLGADEQAQAARFSFEQHRRRFVAHRAALRAVLGERLGRAPWEVRFIPGPYGKPALREDASGGGNLHFNLSHSDHLALIGVHAQAELGVDIERCRADLELEQIARRFFSPLEQAQWLALPAPQRRAAFFALWTQKEAYMKATGQGLSLEPQSFTIGNLPQNTQIYPLDTIDGFAAAVCLMD